jgi:hypothetical protein
MGVLVLQTGAGARPVARGLLKESPLSELLSRLDQFLDRNVSLVGGLHTHVFDNFSWSAFNTLVTQNLINFRASPRLCEMRARPAAETGNRRSRRIAARTRRKDACQA